MLKLRDYQEQAISNVMASFEKPVSVIGVAATGAGKTVVTLELASRILRDPSHRVLYVAHRRDLISQPEERIGQFWPQMARQFGIVMASRNQSSKRLIIASIQTLSNPKRINQILSHGAITHIIIDECFVAGTKIDGKPIEDIKVGDIVQAWDESESKIKPGRVSRLYKNRAPGRLIKISIGGKTIVCTEEHPILCDDNWVHAKDIRVGDELTYNQDIRNGVNSNDEDNTQDVCGVQHGFCSKELEFNDDTHMLRGMQSCEKGEKEEGCNCAVCRVRRDSGVQGTQVEGQESSRRKENSTIRKVRVDSVEVLELGGNGEFERMCPDGFVYNFEVEGYHTYTANGIVVHNCHRAGSQTYMAMIEACRSYNADLRVLGVTATPERSDGSLIDIFPDGESFTYGTRELIEMNYLVRPEIRGVFTNISVSDVGVEGSGVKRDYNKTKLSSVYETDNCFELVVESHNQYAAGRSGIAFTVSVDGAYRLAEAFNNAGIPAIAVDGKTSIEDRAAAIDGMKSGKHEMLVNCLDEETEILTKRGWMGIDSIRKDDVTAAVKLEKDSSTVVWEPVSRVVNRHRSENERMVVIKNQSLDIRVTEGHRMVTRSSKGCHWLIRVAGELPDMSGCYSLPLSAMGNPEQVPSMPEPPEMFTKVGRRSAMRYYLRRKKGVPEGELESRIDAIVERKKGVKYKSPDELTLWECEFIGLFLADGCLGSGGRGIQINQSQRYIKANSRIREILNGCGFDYSVIEKDGSRTNCPSTYMQNLYRIPVGVYGGEIERAGYINLIPYIEKDFSDYLFGMNREQTIALVKGIWLGDGVKDGRKGTGAKHWNIGNTNKVFLDKLQALCVTRGLSASISLPRENGSLATKPIYSIGIKDRTDCKTNNHHIKTSGGNPAKFEDGWKDERVWCVTNETGTIITRRNGKVAIMGQCMLYTEGFDLPMLEVCHLARPMRQDGPWMQCVGRVLRLSPETGKENALVLDYLPKERTLELSLHKRAGKVGQDGVKKSRKVEGEGGGINPFIEDVPLVGVGNGIEYVLLDYFNDGKGSDKAWSATQLGWRIIGLGQGDDGIQRSLAVSPAADQMSLWGIWKKPGERWNQAAQIETGDCDTVLATSEDLIKKHGSKALVGKSANWRNNKPSAGSEKFGRGLRVYRDGMMAGELSDAINEKLAMQALKRVGAL